MCVDHTVAAIAIYDPYLTFPNEIHCIWRRKKSIVTVLFVICRYGTVCRAALAFALMSDTSLVSLAVAFIFCLADRPGHLEVCTLCEMLRFE